MHTLDGVFLPCVCAVPRDHGGCEVCMAPVPLQGAEVDPRGKPMRGRGLPEGRGADVSLADTGAVFGFAKSALDAAAGPRGGGAGHVFVIAAGRGQEPGGGCGAFSRRCVIGRGGHQAGGGRGPERPGHGAHASCGAGRRCHPPAGRALR